MATIANAGTSGNLSIALRLAASGLRAVADRHALDDALASAGAAALAADRAAAQEIAYNACRRLNLLEILDWDFNWQQNYRYQRPIRLPADTRLEMEFVYDNTAQNPRNPSRPPKRVGWGPETTDEMAGLHFQVIPADPADASELAQTLWGKLIRFIGAGGLRHTGTQNEAVPTRPPQP